MFLTENRHSHASSGSFFSKAQLSSRGREPRSSLLERGKEGGLTSAAKGISVSVSQGERRRCDWTLGILISWDSHTWIPFPHENRPVMPLPETQASALSSPVLGQPSWRSSLSDSQQSLSIAFRNNEVPSLPNSLNFALDYRHKLQLHCGHKPYVSHSPTPCVQHILGMWDWKKYLLNE